LPPKRDDAARTKAVAVSAAAAQRRRFNKLTFSRLHWVSRHMDTEARFVENPALKTDFVARLGAVDERSGR
jgi:hypothetical protein